MSRWVFRGQVAASFLGRRGTDRPEDTMPFVLVQGPPGTGKTHTVKGILNVWHLVHYQRYYNSLVAALTSDARKSVLMNHMHDALERRYSDGT
jgi:SpoVK/Ycf46/Vps4 family AAA+-type ATPase